MLNLGFQGIVFVFFAEKFSIDLMANNEMITWIIAFILYDFYLADWISNCIWHSKIATTHSKHSTLIGCYTFLDFFSFKGLFLDGNS